VLNKQKNKNLVAKKLTKNVPVVHPSPMRERERERSFHTHFW